MSNPRCKSPHNRSNRQQHEDPSRKFPWDEPEFDPKKLVAQLDSASYHRGQQPRGDPEDRWRSFKKEDGKAFRRNHTQPYPDEPGFRTPPPLFPDQPSYGECRRLSPKHPHHRHDGRAKAGQRERRREDFIDQGYPEGRSRDSPVWLAPEKRASSGSHSREHSVGRRREGQGRSQERHMEHSPGAPERQGRAEGRRWERSWERKDTSTYHLEKHEEDSYRDRSPISNQHRKDMEGHVHPGYEKEEELRGRPRDGYREAHGGVHSLKPLVVEHGHGIANNRGPPAWDMTNGGRQDAAGSPQMGFKPDRNRSSNDRSGPWEEGRETPFQDGRRDHGRESRRGPVGNNRTNQPGKFSPQRGHGNFRASPPPARGRMDVGGKGAYHDGKLDATPVRHDFPQRRQESDQEHQDVPREDPVFPRRRQEFPRLGRPEFPSQNYQKFPRPGLQEFPRQGHQQFSREGRGSPQFGQGHKDFNQGRQGQLYREQMEDNSRVEPQQKNPGWEKDSKPHVGRGSMSGEMSRTLNPVGPGQRGNRWKSQPESSEVMVVSEETLTIKVDMNRPKSKNSALCYSTDRQLSLDLVNVGRQRLDFLPMMEHSGTYRENAVQSGTFAQEVISLVHQVKEQYFRGNAVSLNERFSAPRGGGTGEAPEEAVMEDQRPTLNKRFTMTMKAPVSEPVFTVQAEPEGPLRDPMDLRNSLERRRQERTEAVRITISGGTWPQGAPVPSSESAAVFGETEEEEEEGGFSSCPERPSLDPQGSRNLRFQGRGRALRRPNVSPPGHHSHFGNRLGPPQR